MPISEQFTHAPEEIIAQSLLPDFEKRIETEHIIPELEALLAENHIPVGGITAFDAKTFSCSPQLKEVLSFGLFDRTFIISSERQRQTEGKVIANTGAAIIIGKVMDAIYEERFSHIPACSLQSVFEKIHALPIPSSPSAFVTEDYLSNTQVALIEYFRNMLQANVRIVMREIAQRNNDDPYKILYKNIAMATEMDPYDFIAAGLVSETNNLYALLQLITVRGPKDLRALGHQAGKITREQTLAIFHGSRSAVLRGLAKNDRDIFRELIDEGRPGNPQVGDALLTYGQRPNRKQGSLAPFLYNSDMFHIYPKEETLGTVVLSNVDSVIQTARKTAYQDQETHPSHTRAEPRVVFGCPARAPRAYGKPNPIKYIHVLAVQVLEKLNEQYPKITP